MKKKKERQVKTFVECHMSNSKCSFYKPKL